MGSVPLRPSEQPSSTQEIQFSIPGPVSVLIRVPRPLTEETWKRIIAVLKATKPPVVSPSAKTSGG